MRCKSYSHFFSKKFQHICVSLDVNFNESLTNDIVSFEELGPGLIFYFRFHPPAVVGVMGSAAAAANLLKLNQLQATHALAIAASFAGAPMANAGTPTKPLHCGNSARFGLEAALMARSDVQGNHAIFDNASGFAAFFDDFDPQFLLRNADVGDFVLEYQDVAIKSYPAHLGMHWAIDAALNVRQAAATNPLVFVDNIERIEIKAPKSKYIDRSIPDNEHEARHSFQFNSCTALLDGAVTIDSYQDYKRTRPELRTMLEKTVLITEEDNVPSFETMYVEVSVYLQNGHMVSYRCTTPKGHWRKPLNDTEVERKFIKNTEMLTKWKQDKVAELVWNLDTLFPALSLTELL